MIIGFVVDQFDATNNGTTASARRFVDGLRALGHTVRVLATGNNAKDKFVLPVMHIPIVSFFADKQGITFAKPVESVIREFLTGLDIVHFYFPFPLGRTVSRIATEMHVPCIAAFHVQPENATYNIGLGKVQIAADFAYKFLYHYFFKRFSDIHCPTKFIADELYRHGYKAHMHVISNGVSERYKKGDKIAHENFCILMMGRLAPEKRQYVLIKAAKLSKYSDKIQLIFTGRGPCLEKLKKQSTGLKLQPIFGFYPESELRNIILKSDLYVHASNVEIEAISCMEAFSCGLVPVISDSKASATKSFALDSRSLFKSDDAYDLANKIDYWIEHESEKNIMSDKYAELGESIRVSISVKKMEAVYRNIIDAHKNV